jgi:hypothetical protein
LTFCGEYGDVERVVLWQMLDKRRHAGKEAVDDKPKSKITYLSTNNTYASNGRSPDDSHFISKIFRFGTINKKDDEWSNGGEVGWRVSAMDDSQSQG